MEIIYKNDLRENLIEMKSQGVGVIINLLSLHDLRVIGVTESEYENQCKELKIELISFPIQSMKGPKQLPEEFDKQLIGKFAIICLSLFL